MLAVLASAIQTSEADEVDVDVGAWIQDHPLWAAALLLLVVVALITTARWLIRRPWAAVVLVGSLVAAVVLGFADLIPFAILVFLVIGVISAPYRWWVRRRGPRYPASVIPPEPEPMPYRCTAPTIGPCPIHGQH